MCAPVWTSESESSELNGSEHGDSSDDDEPLVQEVLSGDSESDFSVGDSHGEAGGDDAPMASAVAESAPGYNVD